MANIVEAALAWVGVYKIEKTDAVLGGDGVDDIANKQAHLLIQRDNYLKGEVEKQSKDLYLALLDGKYKTNDLIVSGVTVTLSTTTTTDDTASWTAGSIYYNGRVYPVPASGAGVVKTGANVHLYKIDTTVEPNIIKIDQAATGTGIANLGASNVIKFLAKTIITGTSFPNECITSLSTVAGCTPGITSIQTTGDAGICFSEIGGMVRCSGMVYIDIPDSTANDLFLSGSGYDIGFIKLTLVDKFKGQPGNSISGGEAKTHGIAICHNGAVSGSSVRGFTNSVSTPCFIDEDGNLVIDRIPKPGADKRVLIAFSLDYFKKQRA